MTRRQRDLEAELALLMRVEELPEPERQHRFHPVRKWQVDFAWPDSRLAVEVEGGVWTRGRHQRPAGFIRDCEKYNELALAGWLLIRVTAPQIDSGEALDWIRRGLVKRGTHG